MRMVRCVCLLAAAGLAAPLAAQPKEKGVWTDPHDPTLPADFKIQGEYAGARRQGRLPGDRPGQGRLPGGRPAPAACPAPAGTARTRS